jgi:membrane protein
LWARAKGLGRLLWDAGRAWRKDNVMRLSAAVAMYSILSLSPLLVITIKVMGIVLEEQAASRQVERQVQDFLGPRGAAAVNDMLVEAGKDGAGVWATVVSVGFLLFTASGVFVEFRDAMNALWGIDPRRNSAWWSILKERLLSVGMVLAVGFLLLVTQVLTTVLTVLSEYLAGGAGWASVTIDFLTSMALLTALFALLFRFLPDARVGWGYVLAGAAVTAVLFKIGQFLQALYFAHGTTASLYGAAGSFVVVLLWVYYSCWIVFYGAELIQVYARRRGERLIPVGRAETTGATPGQKAIEMVSEETSADL